MADPVTLGVMAVGSMAASAVGGITGAQGARLSGQAQQTQIQGQMLQAFGQAFGMDVQAQQYDYQANIDKYQAGVADVNAQISKANAAYARDVGEVEESQLGLKLADERNTLEVSQAASGIDVNSGSSARVRQSMVELGQWDEAQVRASAAKTAYGYEVEATMNRAQADIYRYTAVENESQANLTRQAADFTRASATAIGGTAYNLAGKGADVSALGSLVGAAGSVASKWSTAGTSGALNFGA